MIKIGVISDSHHKSDVAGSAINYLLDKKADLIIHAGDIVEISTLKALKNSKIPYVAVFGNNDNALKDYAKSFKIFKEPKIFNFRGLKIRLMHYPYYIKNDADIVIYGHTHYFAALKSDSSLILNPGEICGRKKPLYEFAIIEIYHDIGALGDNSVLKFNVIKVQSKILKSPIWQEFSVEI